MPLLTAGRLHTRLTSGRFNNYRVACVLLTQLLYFGLPWLQFDGRQAVLFDLPHGRFYLFGALFLPQDAVYLAGLLIFCALALFGSSAFGGRLWCGFACPQTVYGQIMLWLERAIAGDHVARRKLDAAGGMRRMALRGLVGLAQAAFSLWVGVTLALYFSPARALWPRLWRGELSPAEGLWIAGYALFTFLLAAVLREKVCLHMCPYARFQGAMFDRHTRVVSYDARRGEPRGKGARAGGCVDCGICVQVCPTGIDIRQGLQYACTGCAACIDACDRVMDRLGAPRGLIRHASEAALAERPVPPWYRRGRLVTYAALMLAVLLVCAGSLSARMPFRADVLRDRAELVRDTGDGAIENSYSIRLMNATPVADDYSIAVAGPDGLVLSQPSLRYRVPAGQAATIGVSVRAPDGLLARGVHDIEFVIRSRRQPDAVLHEGSRFISR